MSQWKPTPAELVDARDNTLPDVIAPGLRVLFCGINPGVYSTAVGRHFGRPGNRFWSTLYLAGLTPRLLTPEEDHELLTWGFGLTNIVARTTTVAADLTREELRTGQMVLDAKVRHFAPRVLAILGISAYRIAFAQPRAKIGRQDSPYPNTDLWVLPNPSGLNAHYQLADLAQWFRIACAVTVASGSLKARHV